MKTAIDEIAPESGVCAVTTRRELLVLAYASLADLLSDVDGAIWADLPAPQQKALDAALVRRHEHAGHSDPRAVAAAFVTVLDRLTARSEGFVLLAIDDLQWIDVSSTNAVAFAARRLPRGVGLLCTTRSPDVAARVQLARPDAVERMRLQPLTVDALHRVLRQRLGISVPRPMLLAAGSTAPGCSQRRCDPAPCCTRPAAISTPPLRPQGLP